MSTFNVKYVTYAEAQKLTIMDGVKSLFGAGKDVVVTAGAVGKFGYHEAGPVVGYVGANVRAVTTASLEYVRSNDNARQEVRGVVAPAPVGKTEKLDVEAAVSTAAAVTMDGVAAMMDARLAAAQAEMRSMMAEMLSKMQSVAVQ